jgi:hypothetical protein
MDSSSKKSNEEIERRTATVILTPFATAACAQQRVNIVKRVGEDNVIDPLRGWLKQKRSHVHKRAILFMIRENKICRARPSSQADLHRSRSLALGAVV